MTSSLSKPTDDDTDRIGINAVEAVFLKEMKWIFREQKIKDFGVDAQVKIKKNGEPTGKLIALQIKAGPSYLKPDTKGGFRYNGTMKHLDYWSRHSLPVFLILHDSETGNSYWQRIERRLVKINAKGWSISVPKKNLLGEASKRFLEAGIASDPGAVRRFEFALDKELMEKIGTHEQAFMRVFDYNKTLNMRGAWFRFDDENKVAHDLELNVWQPFSDIYQYMERFFPWLDYRFSAPNEERGGGEAIEHNLEVRLNDAAKAFLLIENFFENGPAERELPMPPKENDDEWFYDEDEHSDWAFEQAMLKD